MSSPSPVGSGNRTLANLDTSQISTTFFTGGVDLFYFSIQLVYPTAVEQTVTVNVYSGSEQRQSTDEIPVRAENLTLLNFNVIVAQEPHYPSVEEIWNFTPIPTRQDFLDMMAYIIAHTVTSEYNLEIIWVIVALQTGIIVFVLFIFLRRPRKE